jgi:chemotaxis protein methyltransferase CheR
MNIRYFADYIEKELGIVYGDDCHYQLKSRLNDISQSLQLNGVEELYKIAQSDGIRGYFKQLLLDVATNNETYFFRDPKIFKTIQEKIIPDIITQNPMSRYISIWSAACSFGQEPYSIAMINEEMKAKDPKTPRFIISASDISSQALAYAKAAKYSQLEIQRGLKAALIIKYFKKNSDNYWELNPGVKLAVEFFEKNLLELHNAKRTYDIILCRNVLIYQSIERKKSIIANLTNYLKNDGILILGSSESLFGLSDAFNQRDYNGIIYHSKKPV